MPRAKRITRKYSGLKKIKKAFKVKSKGKSKRHGYGRQHSHRPKKSLKQQMKDWKKKYKTNNKDTDKSGKDDKGGKDDPKNPKITKPKGGHGGGKGKKGNKHKKGFKKAKSKNIKSTKKKVSAVTSKKLTIRQRVINAALAGGLGSGLKYKAAAKAAKKKDKNYRTNPKYNSYYQMIDCSLLKQLNGTPEKDLEVYNKLLEIDQETKTMIADLQNIVKQGDTNLATVKAGINSLMKNELNEVTFNVGGTAPLYEMIYHINENLNEHLKENSFTNFQKNFIAAANKHAKVEMDYFQEYTKLVYAKMGRELKDNEVKYNAFAKSHATNSDVKQTYTIPVDGKYSTRFRLVSGAEVPVAERDSYTLIKENTYGPIVNNKNEIKKKYAPIRANAKKLSGTIK